MSGFSDNRGRDQHRYSMRLFLATQRLGLEASERSGIERSVVDYILSALLQVQHVLSIGLIVERFLQGESISIVQLSKLRFESAEFFRSLSVRESLSLDLLFSGHPMAEFLFAEIVCLLRFEFSELFLFGMSCHVCGVLGLFLQSDRFSAYSSMIFIDYMSEVSYQITLKYILKSIFDYLTL